MTSAKTIAVIPAGGAGTRLWPRSRRSKPKHTLPLATGHRALLRDTYDRFRGLADEIYVVTELVQRDIIRSVLPEIDDSHLIIEPIARGTTNAYGLAALTVHDEHPDAVMVAMASDHVVHGRAAVTSAVRTAIRAAQTTDNLVLFGLKPTFPSTGLGYVHAPRRGPIGTRRVESFKEKPDLRTATRFLKAGGYYWNLAWFAWRVEVFLAQLAAHA
ncbi:MAG TPA: sugar phosphate nucleotidyltransferase, partial [Candidatus Dormibacteraeota bacterium]|nr:sugar phosphate nucleotidyltransferase [Candidatus Dormibacteraeota bacterium]